MTKRLPIGAAPGPLEEYTARFDDLFGARAQREGFRRYLEGLLLPAERNKTLTALANAEPVVGAQHARAQSLQWFLSESGWDLDAVSARRLELLRAEPGTAPDGNGVLIIDEHGDRKDGKKTAHVGKQYLANIGKVDNGVVSVSSLWADEEVYYPLEVEPYTPAHHFEKGKADSAFRTKLKIAGQLVERSVQVGLPFRAVVADSFYGEDEEFKMALDRLGAGYVLSLKKSHCWWHKEGEEIGALWEAAEAAGWKDAAEPGKWKEVARIFRDGHRERWWALEVQAGPYGPQRARRAVVATTDPEKLPDLATWHLTTNLPAPSDRSERATESELAAADLAEVLRLYGLRMWVEQSYKQVKHRLGFSQYQVRSDIAIRRHWQLVFCAFSFCWHGYGRSPTNEAERQAGVDEYNQPVASKAAGRGKNGPRAKSRAEDLVAGGIEGGEGVAGAMDDAAKILESVLGSAPARRVRDAA